MHDALCIMHYASVSSLLAVVSLFNITKKEGAFIVDEICSVEQQCINKEIQTNRDYSCSEHAVCGDRNGVHRCHCDEGYEGDGQTCESVNKKDCYELLLTGNTEDGIYTIYPDGYPGGALEVYCDMTTDGGGWTVIQNRCNLDIDFYLGWEDYKNGFGDLNGDFWLGNEAIHYLTNQKESSMTVESTNEFTSEEDSVLYSLVTVGSEDDNYRLFWNGFHGVALQYVG
ncbi:hypothetical protein BSL78_19491 [Apostichopus japonicus]|uniref:Fibrinogen C-terminal domain-containing protein n=1 Tax=Stichopus japonicus TaxID=307972 RepID=A0A2G8K6L1_STIJA|nr:hypothetical protein BSL78_19491 [Apostichopus japonicus]